MEVALNIVRNMKMLARMIHESVSRDREDGLATWQPQGLESEAYLNSTSQGEPVLSEVEGTPEDARKDGHIYCRSNRFMNYSGCGGQIFQ